MIRSLHFLSITYLNNLPVVLFCYLASNAIILLGYSFYVLLSYQWLLLTPKRQFYISNKVQNVQICCCNRHLHWAKSKIWGQNASICPLLTLTEMLLLPALNYHYLTLSLRVYRFIHEYWLIDCLFDWLIDWLIHVCPDYRSVTSNVISIGTTFVGNSMGCLQCLRRLLKILQVQDIFILLMCWKVLATQFRDVMVSSWIGWGWFLSQPE